MLTTAEAAYHFGLEAATLRRKIRAGELLATRAGRDYRLSWETIWACERGPMPKRGTRDKYKRSLLSKRHLADALSYDIRTVERWIFDGLPTRNVFGSVRINPEDAKDWLKAKRGLEIDVLERPAGDLG